MRWAVILAGGAVRRSEIVPRSILGNGLPRQFSPLIGGRTPFSYMRCIVERFVAHPQTLCVVNREHEPYYRREMRQLHPYQIFEQPMNRGTAAAIAFAAARIARVDKRGVIGVFPADHHYQDVDLFSHVVDETYELANQYRDFVFLLGADPDGADVDYGWIETGRRLESAQQRVFTVNRFWEKPAPPIAQQLLASGCLWNMFVMAGCVSAFRRLLYSAAPVMTRVLEIAADLGARDAHLVSRI